MEFGGASVSGPRPYNEDSYLTIDLQPYSHAMGGLLAFLLVSDGMGGHQGGDVASRLAVESARSYVDDLISMTHSNALNVDAAQALREIVEEAQAAITKEAGERGISMGATFVGAFVSRDHAWIGHVGDSRAYALGAEGGRQLTVDHSQVGRLIAEGVLTEEQAQSHPSRNVIERALGFSGAEAEITEVDLNPGDAIVLNSDGLSTVLAAHDLWQIAARAGTAREAAELLCAEAIGAGTDDNTTAVVWAEDWRLFTATVPGVRQTRRSIRRQRSLHVRATRASFIAIGVVLVATLGVLAFASSGPKGGAVIVPVSKPTSSKTESSALTATTTPGGSTETTVPSKHGTQNSGRGSQQPKKISINNGARLRINHIYNSSLYAQMNKPATGVDFVYVQSGLVDPKKSSLWYAIRLDDLKGKLSVIDKNVKPSDGIVWVASNWVTASE